MEEGENLHCWIGNLLRILLSISLCELTKFFSPPLEENKLFFFEDINIY